MASPASPCAVLAIGTAGNEKHDVKTEEEAKDDEGAAAVETLRRGEAS